jgi:hypothetical protein
VSEGAVTPEWKRWVEAARVLAADPTAQVPCPRHGDGILVVEDGSDPANPALVERYLRCPACGTYNVIRNPRG